MAANNVQIKYTKIFINNEWHTSASGKTFVTLNPATEQTLATIQEGDKQDIDKAVAAAVKAFSFGSAWSSMDASQRGTLLNKLADLIERDQEYLARLETLDNGKPYQASFNVDIPLSVKTLRYYAGYADKIHGKTIPSDGDVFSYTTIEPVGVCGQIIPWNYPMLMVAWKLGPALASGCTVVLKPAEQTPLTALYIASLISEAGFPPGVVNVVPGYGPTAGQALVEHPDVAKIAFTGSTEVGRLIMRNCANTVKRISLELGGKSPLIVTENIDDIGKAAALAQEASFTNMGQCCVAGTRTFVHESIYEEFVKKSGEIAKKRVYGDPFNDTTINGPQIDADQTNKIIDLIESGKKEGARLMAGGCKAKGKGYFIEPTVFADVNDKMRIAQEEIFGPVQQIFKYKSFDEVLERANDSIYGLGAGILCNDVRKVLKFTKRIRAGTVWVNTYLHFSHTNPFGGFKQSGLGRELGEEGLHGYGEVKTVVFNRDF